MMLIPSGRFMVTGKLLYAIALHTKTRAGGTCIVRVELGKARCRFHGGLSTGPKTKMGRARIAEARAGAGVPTATPVRGTSSSSRLGEMESATTEAQPIAGNRFHCGRNVIANPARAQKSGATSRVRFVMTAWAREHPGE